MLINIQFLRFVAALLVVVYHTNSHLIDSGATQGTFFVISEAIGFAGVDIFFVISGFIMAYTTHASHGVADGWSFARRRLARIYSGYWPFFLLAILLFAWIDPARLEWSSLLTSAFLWPTSNTLIAVSWTLTFEMFFYVLYTFLVMYTRQHRITLLYAMLGLIIGWSLFSQFVRHAYDPGQLEYMSAAEYYMLGPYLAEFLAGAILAVWMRKSSDGPGMVWLLLGVVLFLAGGWINNHQFDGGIEQGYFVFYRVLVFGLASLLITAGLVRLESAGFKAPLKFSLYAGGASYAIYLSHTLLLAATQKLGFNAYVGQLSDWLAQFVYMIYAVVILIISVIHYVLNERPIHRYFKRVLRV
jgi:exopolysaccharide production protein ExoZ